MADIYTDEQKDKALKALVLADLDVPAATRRLNADGIEVKERTLREWRNVHADKIAALLESREWVQQLWAERWESFGADALAKAQATLDEFAERRDWDKVNAATHAKAIKDLSTTAAIAQDKSRTIRGEPVEIHESRDLASLLRAAAKFSQVLKINEDLIESTAQEVTTQELQSATAAHTHAEKPARDHKRDHPTEP